MGILSRLLYLLSSVVGFFFNVCYFMSVFLCLSSLASTIQIRQEAKETQEAHEEKTILVSLFDEGSRDNEVSAIIA